MVKLWLILSMQTLYLGKMSSIYPELVRRVITYGLGSERVSSFSTMVRPSADRTLMTSFEGSISIETFEFKFEELVIGNTITYF